MKIYVKRSIKPIKVWDGADIYAFNIQFENNNNYAHYYEMSDYGYKAITSNMTIISYEEIEEIEII